jgi:hypothetical protein
MVLQSLISVHVAKAGGSSVGRMLKIAYGDAFLHEHQDNPANCLSQRVLDPHKYFGRKQKLPHGIRCIHGHFHPGKFDIADGTVLFTLLRHPVDNILSIYFFWRAMERQPGDALHSYFLDNNLTIAETAKLPLIRWLFSRTYFEGFDMNRFDIIGRHSNREVALGELSARIGFSLDTKIRENVTPASDGRIEAANDMKLRRDLEGILSDDIKFYERFSSRGV